MGEGGMATVLTLVLVAWMLIDGYSRRGTGIFRWSMFTSHCAVVADLAVDSVPVNMFDHLPPDAVWITPREFDGLLAFLAGAGRVDGTGVFHGNDRTFDIEIVDSRVAVRGTR